MQWTDYPSRMEGSIFFAKCCGCFENSASGIDYRGSGIHIGIKIPKEVFTLVVGKGANDFYRFVT